MNKNWKPQPTGRSIISGRGFIPNKNSRKPWKGQWVFSLPSPPFHKDIEILEFGKKLTGDSLLLCHEHHRSFRWEKRLRMYMERCSHVATGSKPGRCKALFQVLPSLWSDLDALELSRELQTTICGRRCLFGLCEDNQGALDCFGKIPSPPFFFKVNTKSLETGFKLLNNRQTILKK